MYRKIRYLVAAQTIDICANLTPGQGLLLALRPASAMSASPLESACGVCQSALKVRKQVAVACCSRLGTLLQVID